MASVVSTRRVLAHLLSILVLIAAAGCRIEDARSSDPSNPDLEDVEVPDGFRVELFASEPLLADPIAMTVDEEGRLFVVEDGGYPEFEGRDGRIVRLSDTDGDGRPDRRTVFADSLLAPMGVMTWKDGLLVPDAPDLLYLVDEDGDGVADRREAILTGFELHAQAGANSPIFGLDNWIYLAAAAGEDVHFPDAPNGPRLEEVSSNIRVRPETHRIEVLSGRSQFGHTFDRWGRHILVNNSDHVYVEILASRYLERNPDLLVPEATESISDHGEAAQVFPITEDPEFQMFTDVGVITSACGITCYMGGLFPEEFENATIVAENVHNLAHVDTLAPRGASFRAGRLYEEREFFASRDSWSRPVNFYVGPDGALYVVDFYRLIIDRPRFLSDSVLASTDLYAGSDMGRIYRVLPEDASTEPWLDRLEVGHQPSGELVDRLDSENIWWRRTAQRLLHQRGDGEAVPRLRELARSGTPVGRLHALWTLEGAGRLSADLIVDALRAGEPGLRENAIRLAERHLEEFTSIEEELYALSDDPSQRVRFQLLATLGSVPGERAESVRREILFGALEDRWIQFAALSARDLEAFELFELAREELSGERRGAVAFMERLGAVLGGAATADQIDGLLTDLVERRRAIGEAWWIGPTISGLSRGLRANREDPASLGIDGSSIADAFFATETSSVRRGYLDLLDAVGLPRGSAGTTVLERARRIAENRDEPQARRQDAIRLMSLERPAEHLEVLKRLLRADEPAGIQQVVVDALSEIEGDEVAEFVLSRWSRLSLSVREGAVDMYMEEPSRKRMLLDAVADGTVQRTTINWPRMKSLMLSEEPDIEERARELLARHQEARRKVVAEYREALSQTGDPREGRAVFARVCARCHQTGGTGGVAFGPDIGTIKNRTRGWILTHILRPHQAIAQGYASWIVRTEDGSSVSGLLESETPTSVTIETEPGRTVTIRRENIRSMEGTGRSAMPAGLEDQISVAQMADLLAYIKSSG